MNNRHINFYFNLNLLFLCNINGTQLQSLPSLLYKFSENDPVNKNINFSTSDIVVKEGTISEIFLNKVTCR